MVLQRRNRTTGSDWVAETHAYPLAAAASGVRHRASNSSIYHVDHDMYDGAPAPAPVLHSPAWHRHPQADRSLLCNGSSRFRLHRIAACTDAGILRG